MTDRQLRLGAVWCVGVLVCALLLTAWMAQNWHPKVTVPDVVHVAPAAAVVSAAPAQSSAGQVEVSAQWVAKTAVAAGIPAPAVKAYGESALLLAQQDPGCHLGWTTLAGLGYVESLHGTIGGRTLLADGYSSTPIIGPALDGKGYAAIRATAASARLQTDPIWDHAVGPLQFIASTWQRWGADGDGDGKADPYDINDAVYAAAHYLCADGHDLATAAGWNAGVYSYNHASSYVLAVYDAAEAYAQRTG